VFAHRRGRLITRVIYRPGRTDLMTGVGSRPMAPKVETEDLIDAHEVAEILGLAHRNTVSVYQRRYEDMPRPVVDLGPGRPRLWLRTQIERWSQEASRRRKRAKGTAGAPRVR
jgi:predicted DNA-binding transcriptional regulator AlpA